MKISNRFAKPELLKMFAGSIGKSPSPDMKKIAIIQPSGLSDRNLRKEKFINNSF